MTDLNAADQAPVQHPKQFRAVVASALNMPMDSAKRTKELLATKQEWQTEEAWPAYDSVPEVKFGVNFLANGMSQVSFFAAARADDGSFIPIGAPESPLVGTQIATAADVEMERLRAPSGGQGEINRMLTLNLEVAGEAWIHGKDELPEVGIEGQDGYRAPQPETWDVRSVSEVQYKGADEQGRAKFHVLDLPEAKGEDANPDTEQFIRVYQRHPQWSRLPDSHVKGCLSDIELLTLLVNQQKAEAKSRQAPGILLVPSELSFTQDPQAPASTGGDGAQQQQSQNPFLRALHDALVAPIEDPTSSASVMPLIITGPSDYLKPEVFRLLSFARTSDGELQAKIDKAIDRVARGLNVPVEAVMGHMSTTFANAAQINQDEFDDHFRPRCVMLADAYLNGFLRPRLEALGYPPEVVEQVHVWFDPLALLGADTDPSENADELLAAGAISMAAYRRMKGVDESDAPDELEQLFILARTKGIYTADLTSLLLQKAGVLDPEDIQQVAQASSEDVAVADEGTDTDAAAALMVARGLTAEQATLALSVLDAMRKPMTTRRVGTQLRTGGRRRPLSRRDQLMLGATTGRKLAAIDRDLRAKLHAAADGALARALEVAGARLKSRNGAVRDQLRTVPKYAAAATLGPRGVVAAGFTDDTLLRDAFGELEGQFKSWLRAGGAEALNLTADLLGAPIDVRREELLGRQAELIDEAWRWFSGELTEHGKLVLYHPEKGAAALLEKAGEFDATTRVQVGLIREAMARAGGATGLGGLPGIVRPSGSLPVGGIATGEMLREAMREAGATLDRYRWIYGPATRNSFAPHRELDGQVFTGMDDPALANTSGFPDDAFYFPGDHAGCVCDWELIIEPPNQEV